MKYNNWTITETKDGNEIVWSVRHDSSEVPYLIYDFTLDEVKEWIDEQNEFANEAVTNV